MKEKNSIGVKGKKEALVETTINSLEDSSLEPEEEFTQHVVVVASTDDQCLEAVQDAFDSVFPDTVWKVVGVELEIDGQAPICNVRSAILSAKEQATLAKEAVGSGEYWIGFQISLEEVDSLWLESTWGYLIHSEEQSWVGSSHRVESPITESDFEKNKPFKSKKLVETSKETFISQAESLELEPIFNATVATLNLHKHIK